eukprot:TRINITY_DN64369_c0_g2_i1.p1 TRINITY_DN64369_c0_g2~~TRINITY_DN64369_c0_g2_i1.p1  ORF type:complete len:818 (-),score=181.40 TRINITY_DN64369_c0_g2_i1:248-2701(-)
MSAKQLKKLKQKLREGEGAAPESDEEEAIEEEASDAEPVQKSGGFARLAALAASESEEEVDDSASGSGAEERSGQMAACEVSKEAIQAVSEPPPTTSKSAKRRANKAKAKLPQEVPKKERSEPARKGKKKAKGEEDDDALLDAALSGEKGDGDDEDENLPQGDSSSQMAFERGVLACRRADFSVETERKRVIGANHHHLATSSRAGPSQRRLAVQARQGGQGRTAHYRRLFLIAPSADESWPKPDDCPSMRPVEADDEGELVGRTVFEVEDTPQSLKSLERLREVLLSQDPNMLQDYLRLGNAFSVDGLLVLAEHFRTNGSHEQASQLVRRAVYAVECGFSHGFSPFQPSGGTGAQGLRPAVALRLAEDFLWPGWSALRALWMYMHCLSGAGMQRTALEICKLLLAMTLPRDPARGLLAFDYLCLRSRHYDLLRKFSAELCSTYGYVAAVNMDAPAATEELRLIRCDCLSLQLPNFAYSIALARIMQLAGFDLAGALNAVSLSDVFPRGVEDDSSAVAPEDDEETRIGGAAAAALASLMGALLLFPLALRPLLEEAGAKLGGPVPGGSASKESWTDLLARPPFSDGVAFRHSRHKVAHSNLCAAYAKRCGALWRPDLPMRCLHACAARLATLYESSAFAEEMTAVREAWARSPLPLEQALQLDYFDLSPQEGAVEVPPLPPAFEQAVQARLHPPRQQNEWLDDLPAGAAGRAFRRVGGNAEADVPAPTVSLHSPPFLVFWQSLLPWAEVDKSGIAVEPLSWTDVAKGLWQPCKEMAVWLAALCGAFLGEAKLRLLGPPPKPSGGPGPQGGVDQRQRR